MKLNTKITLVFLIVLFSVKSFLFAQEKIRFGKDQCAHCSMVLRDNLHVAIVIEKNGTVIKFDAIECMINFLKEKDQNNFQKLLVANYGEKGELINATLATYLKTKEIPSPMGAFLSAFGDNHQAVEMQREKGGEIFNWEELVAKFQNSGFGIQIHQHFRPDAYAPIGIMGDHIHHKGGFMMSLRYMNMNMSGNQTGIHSINSETILTNYMVSPEKMNMQMYMLGIMYSPGNRLTVMLMQNFALKNMDMINRKGMDFSTNSSGIGDMKISALYRLVAINQFSFHLNSGINIPIGSTDITDDTPVADDVKLPYAMQLGSGTYDLIIGGTFKGYGDKLSWGIQQINTVRTGMNSQGYRFGDQFVLNTWGAVKAFDWLSFSIRLQGAIQQKIKGMDDELNPMMAPTANPDNYGYKKVDTFIGTNISFPQYSLLKSFKLGFEAGMPVFAKYNGIQMDEKNAFIVGIRYTSL